MILSFIVVSVFVSYFATMHSSHTAANAEERNELSVKKVIYGNPLLNGS
jgi:low temperature requirement protein LtrA